MSRRTAVAGAVMAAVVAVGCGGGRAAAPAPSPDGAREWVAVLETGPPDAAEAAGNDVRARASGAAVVGPIACWPGLAERLEDEPGEYVVAVVAGNREEVETAVAATGREAIFVGELRTDCAH